MNMQKKKFFSHPKALVESDAIGSETRIWAFAHILSGAVVGKNCNICDGVFVEGGAKIGDNVTVKNQCLIFDGVEISDDVFLGPNVVFTNDSIPRSPRQKLTIKRHQTNQWLLKTRVGRGATLGASVTVVCGVTIGEYSMAGAGSVITRDLPPHSMAYGVPARVVGAVCRCGLMLKFTSGKAKCSTCSDSYRKQSGQISRVE